MSADSVVETLGKLVELVASIGETVGMLCERVETLSVRETELTGDVAQLGVNLAVLRQSACTADRLLADDIEQLGARLTSVHTSALRALNARFPGGHTA